MLRSLLATTAVAVVLTFLYASAMYPDRLASASFRPFSSGILPVYAQTFVVNLPRRQDRKPDMERLRVGLGLDNWEYLAATDAVSGVVGRIVRRVRQIREKALKDSGYDLNVNTSVKLPFAWPVDHLGSFDDDDDAELDGDSPPLTCATEDFTLTPYSPTLKQYQLLTRNRIACWHSHLSLIRRAATTQHPTVILEDDIDMEADVRKKLAGLWGSLPTDWDILFLGHCWSNESFHPALSHQAQTNIHPSNAPLCTHAYAISPTGAARLLLYLTHPPFAYSRPIDRALAWLVQSGLVRAFSVVPSVIIQRKIGKSDVAVDGKASAWRDNLRNGFFGGRVIN
ncbi:hypothetical protein HMN09_00238300 [Mycena chlorophos]|uniref:Glycosyl transferase family 25 domain-containing protein n=1 Tax=Mycena chlorophos TaxID=658473 RepID=A0A8H6WJA9_MYCCL|nr:hypothetical protein HMN09_00238300 [Mycena chlorophos]